MRAYLSNIGLLVLSLFCAGGLYAYAREALRLTRLIGSGTVARATLLKKERIQGESVAHHLLTYQFVDADGNATVHEQDVNSTTWFGSLSPGDAFDVLYRPGAGDYSYPLSQIRADRRVAQYIAVGVVLFWLTLGVIFVRLGPDR